MSTFVRSSAAYTCAEFFFTMRRNSYTADFKLKAVGHAKKFGISAAVTEFQVHESMILRWKKNELQLSSTSKNRRAFRGLPARWPDVEKDLMAWVVETRDKKRAINGPLIARKAKEIATKLGITDLKGSRHWVQNFMKRNSLVNRRRTSVGQPLPPDYEVKIDRFQKFCREEANEISLEHICNLDEVPVPFDIVHNQTVEIKGKEDVAISSTGNEKTNFTVVLAVMANGDRLPPMVIFKRKTVPKGNFPGVIIKANPTGWMTAELMKQWLRDCWLSEPNALKDPKKSMIILDSARAHLTEDVKVEIQKFAKMAIIPAGLTKLLQPLDVAVNKPFKDNLRKRWENWMSDVSNALYTKSGRKKKASYETVCEWVKSSFEDISVDCIKNGFRKALTENKAVLTLSNLLDGLNIK